MNAAHGTMTVKEHRRFVALALSDKLGDLPAEQQQAILVAFGRHTGLRPELGEIMIYQGRFYVTIAGMRRTAHKNGLFMGRQARPATKDEKVDAGYEVHDIVWVTTVWRKGCSHPFVGWGKLTEKEKKAANSHTPQSKHPVEVARKRSEYDALRAAFPLDEELSNIIRRFHDRLVRACESRCE